MALEVYFPNDIENRLEAIWQAVNVGRPTYELEIDKARLEIAESILFAVALSFGIDWKGTAAIREGETDGRN